MVLHRNMAWRVFRKPVISHARNELNSIVTSVVDLLAYRIQELVQLKLDMDSAATSRTIGEDNRRLRATRAELARPRTE